MRRERKEPKKKNPALIIILLVLFSGVLIFSAVMALRIFIPQTLEQNRFGELRGMRETNAADDDATAATDSRGMKMRHPFYDLSAIKGLNPDLCGWLWIDDADIDYPVMKSSEDDPEYYLHRDIDREYSYAGTLFVGKGCDFDSDIFIIYGHNMNNGSMFGTLDNYLNEDWAANHPLICLDTLEQHRVYRVFAVFQAQSYAEDDYTPGFRYYERVGTLSEDGFNEVLGEIGSLNAGDFGAFPVYGDQIMYLSTCSYHTENGRFVVAAYRVE